MKKILFAAALATLLAGCKCNQPEPVACDKPCCTDSTLTAAPHGVITVTDDGQTVYTRDITTKSDPFVFDADKEWERTGDPGEVYRKVMGYNDNLMMVKVKFKKGSEGKLHSHPHVQITYVESGEFEFITEPRRKPSVQTVDVLDLLAPPGTVGGREANGHKLEALHGVFIFDKTADDLQAID